MICDLQLLENKQIVWVDSGTLSLPVIRIDDQASVSTVWKRDNHRSQTFEWDQFFYWARWLRLDCDGYSSEETTLDEPESWIQRWSDDQLKTRSKDVVASSLVYSLPLLIDGSETSFMLRAWLLFPDRSPDDAVTFDHWLPMSIDPRERERDDARPWQNFNSQVIFEDFGFSTVN